MKDDHPFTIEQAEDLLDDAGIDYRNLVAGITEETCCSEELDAALHKLFKAIEERGDAYDKYKSCKRLHRLLVHHIRTREATHAAFKEKFPDSTYKPDDHSETIKKGAKLLGDMRRAVKTYDEKLREAQHEYNSMLEWEKDYDWQDV